MAEGSTKPSVAVVGAGMAGTSTAYFLTTKYGFSNVTVIDPFKPGNWWPEKQMLAFVNYSISLLEEMAEKSENVFEMIRGGYAFVTSQKATVEKYNQEGIHCSSIGMGAYRKHDEEDVAKSGYVPSSSLTFNKTLEGLDLISNPTVAKSLYPFVDDSIVGLKHVRKCGWFSVAKYIQWVTDQAKAAGAKFIADQVVSINSSATSDGPSTVTLASGEKLQADYVIICIGPMLKNLAGLLNDPSISLPLINEIHAKVVINDSKKVVPRDAPLVLYDDDITIPWSAEQKAFLESKKELAWMTLKIKGGAHFRPLGGANSNELVGIWTFNVDTDESTEPPFHPTIDDYYGEIVLRGISQFVPGMKQYVSNQTNPRSSGNPNINGVLVGHYCKTPENRPLIGPLSTTKNTSRNRVILVGALSGFGIMSSPAAGDLAARYCDGATDLPLYAHAFRVERYQDSEYLKQIDEMKKNSGQL